MKTADDLIRKVYEININACEQERLIALKYNDQEMLARVEKNLRDWKAKLAQLKD